MDILEKILVEKRKEVAESKKILSFGEALKLAENAIKPPTFSGVLRVKDKNPAIIAELKKASPSAGLIRKDFNPALLAKSLEEAGAAALSVLTEKNFFLGSAEYLKDAKANVKIPILRKDFMFDPYQLCEAKAWGASAALLIAAMLDKNELRALINFADSISLETLVEIHSAAELETALECGAKIIGVNSRNLKTFKFDRDLFEKLISKIPHGRIAVAESGIRRHQDLVEAEKAGAQAALVGTTLMEKPDPSAELKKLLGTL